MLPVTLGLGLINFNARRRSSRPAASTRRLAGAIDTAFRIYMLPQGIFSVAVATVLFPVLARSRRATTSPGFADTVDLGLRQILVLLVPSSVFVGVLAEPLTRLLDERGEFTPTR